MQSLQNVYIVNVLPAISVTGGGTATCNEVDTVQSGVKYNYAKFIISAGLIGAGGFATLKIQESDTSGSGGADITGASWTALVDADDNKVLTCDIALTGSRKRYLTLVATNGANASVMACVCLLGRANEAPITATAAGIKEALIVTS